MSGAWRWLGALACALALPVQAQLFGAPAWQEGEVPPPPGFSVDRLIRFDVSTRSSLVYGIDPQTLSISPVDWVVRYVMVATSASGARNVFYEGIRCATGEVKTYARHNGQAWVAVSDPEWLPMNNRPSRHALQLARQGACDNTAAPNRASDVVRALQQGTDALR